MSKISVKNLDLYYGDFKALKDHRVYRTEWLW